MINDYELIYNYRNTRSEIFLQQIIDKYRPLIWKNIYKFYIEPKDQDDFYQESLLTLMDCLNRFDESKQKTFTKYFELILFRRFIYLKDKTPKYYLYERPELFEDTYTPDFDRLEEGVFLTALEKDVCQLYFYDHQTVESIGQLLKKNEKSIKNTIYRIKSKIR